MSYPYFNCSYGFDVQLRAAAQKIHPECLTIAAEKSDWNFVGYPIRSVIDFYCCCLPSLTSDWLRSDWLRGAVLHDGCHLDLEPERTNANVIGPTYEIGPSTPASFPRSTAP